MWIIIDDKYISQSSNNNIKFNLISLKTNPIGWLPTIYFTIETDFNWSN